MPIIGELGEAADRLAASIHKGLAFGAVVHRDHMAGYVSCNEPHDDLRTIEAHNTALLEHASTFVDLLWRIGHGETGAD